MFIKSIIKSFFPFGIFMQMGLLSELFGGSPSQQTTNPATVYGPQANFLSQLYPQLTNLFQQGIRDPSSIVSGFTPTEQAGQQAALNAAQGLVPTIQGATQGLGTLFGAANPNDPTTQAAISAATAPLFRQFENVVAPSIRRAAGQMGRTGDSKAAQLAASDLFQQAGDIGSQIALQARGQGLNAIQGGLGQLGNLFSAALTPSDVQRGIGAEQRQLQMQQSPFGLIDLFRQAAGAPIVLSGGGTQTGRTPGLAESLSNMFSFNFG